MSPPTDTTAHRHDWATLGHTGAVDSSRPVDRPRPWPALGLGLAAALTLAAWVGLVYAAIRFGHDARSGEPVAWVYLGLAALGAVACLVLTLVLGVRIAALLRGTSPVRAKGGGHRAAR